MTSRFRQVTNALDCHRMFDGRSAYSHKRLPGLFLAEEIAVKGSIFEVTSSLWAKLRR